MVAALAEREGRRDCRWNPPAIVPPMELPLRRWRELVKRKDRLHACERLPRSVRVTGVAQRERRRDYRRHPAMNFEQMGLTVRQEL